MKAQEVTKKIVEHERFNRLIILLILISTVISGALTYVSTEKSFLLVVDRSIAYLFVFELFLRLFTYRVEYLRSGWNKFDSVIIIVSILPIVGAISSLRVLRIFKSVRLLSMIPELQKMIEAVIRSFRGVVAVSTLLLLVWYIFALLGHSLFSNNGPYGQEYFGNVGVSMYSLFEVMTFESWSFGIARKIMLESGYMSSLYFVFFIVLTSFTFLNMFIAVFTNTMVALDIEDGDDEGLSGMMNRILDEINNLKQEINHNSMSDYELNKSK